MQAVIMAGGKGTRLAALTKDEIPKPMVEVAGKPLLLWQVERLKDHGITDILMVIGHLGEKIQEYFGDGERFGVRIRYFVEETPLGTAGSFYYLKDMVEETFFMMSGDLFFDIDFGRMLAFHEKKKAAATLFVHPNGHPYDSDLLVLDEDDRVRKFDSKHNTRDYWYENCVNAGIFVFNRKICDRVPEPVKRNLENDVIQGMIQDGEPVYGYRSPEYVKDVGTVDRIQQTLKDIERGFIAEKSLSRKQKCIFLDRDGTDCATAERAFVRWLDGGCSSPVAAFATVEGETLTLRGMDVTSSGEPIFDTITGPRSQGEALGIALADRIREGTACTAR